MVNNTDNEINKSSIIWSKITAAVALIFTLFQLYTAGFGALPGLLQASIHIGFAIVLAFLIYTKDGRKVTTVAPLWQRIIAFIATLIPLWLIINYERILVKTTSSNMVDIILGVLTIVLLLESSRRIIGLAFPVLAMAALLYAYFGNLVPGIFRHAGFSGRIIIENLYLGIRGIWGPVTNVSATTVAIFVIFGQMLLLSGAGKTFTDISLLISGRSAGGPAKVAVISSALFGTISGVGAANVAVTGSATIPMMIRLKYPANFAGGVESAASTGGQILPPIMGAGAMIMAELIGVPYVEIAIAAAVPAILYYISMYYSVHFTSLKLNFRGLTKDEIPKVREVMSPFKLFNLFGPIFILLILLVNGFSATYSGFWATIMTIILYMLHDRNLKENFINLIRGLQEAGYSLVLMAILSATAQIVVSILGFTGAGVKVSALIMEVGQDSILLSLLLAMLLVILLSMGTPVTAAYLLSAAVAGTALVQLIDNPVAVHLFLFYFAAMSCITPPVCGAVYVAVGISQGNWFKTAIIACRLALAGFIVPFIFVYNPVLLLQGELLDIIICVVTAVIGVIALSLATSGYLQKNRKDIWKTLLMIVGAILSIIPDWTLSLIGIILIALVSVIHHKSKDRPEVFSN